MCGIIAITGVNSAGVKDQTLSDMLGSLAKRGPDDRGFERFDLAAIGQTRLSIVDIASGHQPMKDSERDHSIVFNGEIYGYKEMRKELEAAGHKFSTNSDTEVILKTYAEYGHDCPKYLDGMFAFAIWDNEKKELFIARDRFGKKPLYYSFDDSGTLYLASEIKAILKAGIKGVIDMTAIDNFLTLMYIPPWKTVYNNIKVLLPAHSAIVKNGKISLFQYWQPKYKPINVSYVDAKKEIIKLFEESVKKRMVADVEIGTLLSGGVDSTLVSYYAQKYSSHPLKTFSVGYEGYIDELPFAKQASEKIGTDHYTLQAKSDLVEELVKVIGYMDEPHADSSDFPQHMISAFASTKVKVALSGDGADELFMGYGWYWKYNNNRKIVRIKNAIFSSQYKEHLKLISIFSKDERKKIWKDTSFLNDDIQSDLVKKNGGKGVHKINNFDISVYLPGQLLTKVDMTSMMHSLEIRCPFLDYKLFEYVYNLPTEYKMDNKSGKIILKDILSEIMPKEFVYRRKQGFGAPIKDWLRQNKFRKFIDDNLGRSDANINKFLKADKIGVLINRFYAGDESVAYQIWVLLCLELWFKTHHPTS